MQVENNKNRKLGLNQGWPWPLNRGENYSNKGEKNWEVTALLQGNCLIWCSLIQVKLYNDHPFHDEPAPILSFPFTMNLPTH